jgi:hypothetical protein
MELTAWRRTSILLPLLPLLPLLAQLAQAQTPDMTTLSGSSTHTPTTLSTTDCSAAYCSSILPSSTVSPATTTLPPGSTDTALGGSGSADSNNQTSQTSLVNYYFVFLALILAVGGLGAFFIWRRRRRAMYMMRHSRESALARDLAAFPPSSGNGERSRWYRHGRWGRSEENLGAREEGLNELGEAPPAYAPKTSEERAREEEGGLAVPLQTLSREEAGLKPPDYTEANVTAVERRSSASEGSSRQPEEAGAVGGAPAPRHSSEAVRPHEGGS